LKTFNKNDNDGDDDDDDAYDYDGSSRRVETQASLSRSSNVPFSDASIIDFIDISFPCGHHIVSFVSTSKISIRATNVHCVSKTWCRRTYCNNFITCYLTDVEHSFTVKTAVNCLQNKYCISRHLKKTS